MESSLLACAAIQLIGEDFGEKAALMGILHTQLHQLYFKEGHYQKALEQAQVTCRLDREGLMAGVCLAHSLIIYCTLGLAWWHD